LRRFEWRRDEWRDTACNDVVHCHDRHDDHHNGDDEYHPTDPVDDRDARVDDWSRDIDRAGQRRNRSSVFRSLGG
jgi:hypothetical protein